MANLRSSIDMRLLMKIHKPDTRFLTEVILRRLPVNLYIMNLSFDINHALCIFTQNCRSLNISWQLFMKH